jgi:hypothetical protein
MVFFIGPLRVVRHSRTPSLRRTGISCSQRLLMKNGAGQLGRQAMDRVSRSFGRRAQRGVLAVPLSRLGLCRLRSLPRLTAGPAASLAGGGLRSSAHSAYDRLGRYFA